MGHAVHRRFIGSGTVLACAHFLPYFHHSSAYRNIYDMNPLTAFVTSVRQIIINGTAPAAGALWTLVLAAAVSMAVGLSLFRRLEGDFYKHV